MGRRQTKRIRPKQTRPSRPARTKPGTHPRVMAARLYELHSSCGGDESYLEFWPGDGELYGVMLFAQTYADRLTEPSAKQEATLLRLALTEWLSYEMHSLQLRAIDDARAVGVYWRRIAEALGFVDNEGNPNEGSASNRRDRLKVDVHGSSEDRRQPQVARSLEVRAAQQQLARRQHEREENVRHPEMATTARALLAHYERGELCTDGGDDFWWDQLDSVIDDRESDFERANLSLYVRRVLDGTSATSTDSDAHRVLKRAEALVNAPSTT